MSSRFVPPGDGPADGDAELPAVPRDRAAVLAGPRFEVVPLGPRAEQPVPEDE